MNAIAGPFGGSSTSASTESVSSGVSWAAVIAGAFVTAALSFILMALGAGMGLSSVSPWPNAGLSASRVAPIAILWVILVQIAACSMGGYLAGRLRTKWVSLHTHEVYFRDTAHGFLVWAVGLAISVIFLSSIAASIARDTANISGGGTGAGDYFVDSLFRSDHPSNVTSDVTTRAEARVILVNALQQLEMPPQDRSYLASLVSARTGMTELDSERRVSDTLAAYREAADTARKAVAHSLYWIFVALLIGAFSGSFAATLGGKRRDRVLMV
jgi:hypothetical protein